MNIYKEDMASSNDFVEKENDKLHADVIKLDAIGIFFSFILLLQDAVLNVHFLPKQFQKNGTIRGKEGTTCMFCSTDLLLL